MILEKDTTLFQAIALVVVFLIFAGICLQDVALELVQRSDYPKLSEKCYKVLWQQVLICKIKS